MKKTENFLLFVRTRFSSFAEVLLFVNDIIGLKSPYLFTNCFHMTNLSVPSLPCLVIVLLSDMISKFFWPISRCCSHIHTPQTNFGYKLSLLNYNFIAPSISFFFVCVSLVGICLEKLIQIS